MPFVERQKPGGVPGELGRHPGFIGIGGHMDQHPPELQQRLGGIPVAILLLTVVTRRLLRPGVFQLQGDDGQAVDEQHHIDGFVGVR